MEQCDMAAEETSDRDAVVTVVQEKHECEIQEKTILCDDVHSEDYTTATSLKEEGELSSASDVDCCEQEPLPTASSSSSSSSPAAAAASDVQQMTDVHRGDDVPVAQNQAEVVAENTVGKPFESYRPDEDVVIASDSNSDSDCCFTDSSSSTSSENDFCAKPSAQQQRTQSKPTARTKGELLLEDLPTIEDLHITVDENVQLEEIGRIVSIVEVLVVIQSNADLPPLAEDTILFLEDRLVLGKIFETFGPVSCPLYSVRFNSNEHIAQHAAEIGAKVYNVPRVSEWTHYVFLEHVKAMLGSDASWENDNEPPEWCVDYSDDETERRVKAKLRMRGNVKGDDSATDEDSNELNSNDDSNSPKKMAACRQLKQFTRELCRGKPKLNTRPPPERGRHMRGGVSQSSGRAGEFRSQLQRFRPAQRNIVPSAPSHCAMPVAPYWSPTAHRPPPPPVLTPAHFTVPPPPPPRALSSTSSPSLPPALTRAHFTVPPPQLPLPHGLPNTSSPPVPFPFPPRFMGYPPPPPPPSAHSPVPAQPGTPSHPWTFGMLPPFRAPPIPLPPVSNAVTNYHNRPPPPPPYPPPH